MTTESPMRVKALTPWFGGKRAMAPLIAQELGKHTQYFEPACGSMAVLFAKAPSQKETVNDLHGDLIHLARVVQDPVLAPRLYQRLHQALFCEALLLEAQEHLQGAVNGDLSVERAYWYFLASWMQRGGTAGTERQDYQIAVRWTAGGGSPTVRWRAAVESIPAWHQRLGNVVILRRDLFGIIDRFEDSPETAVYVDPPYTLESRNSHSGKGWYLHEFTGGSAGTLYAPAKADDHERLRDALAAYRQARIVVSYYDCPRVRELYREWTFVDCQRNKNLACSGVGSPSPTIAPELLIVNGPSYAGGEA